MGQQSSICCSTPSSARLNTNLDESPCENNNKFDGNMIVNSIKNPEDQLRCSVTVLGTQNPLVLSSRKDKVIKLQRVPCDEQISEIGSNLHRISGQQYAKRRLNSGTSSQSFSSSTTATNALNDSSLASGLGTSHASLSASQLQQQSSYKSVIDRRGSTGLYGSSNSFLHPIEEVNITTNNQSSHLNQSKLIQSEDILLNVFETYSDGSQYKGSSCNGSRHGYGTFVFANKATYKGYWKNDQMSGRGMLYFSNGKLAYQGQFLENRFNGFGYLNNVESMEKEGNHGEDAMKKSKQQASSALSGWYPKSGPKYYEDLGTIGNFWTRYEGEFKHDEKHGRGRLYFSNGDFLIADFFKGIVSGDAVLHRADTSMLKGYWRNNKLIRTQV